MPGGHRAALLAAVVLAGFLQTRTLTAGFDSGIINFDYALTEYGFPAYGPGAGAIGSNDDFWNSVDVGLPVPLQLMKADGTSTSVQWWVDGNGGSGKPLSGTYAGLLDMDQQFRSATISGLTPNQPYALYLFAAVWPEVVSVNGTSYSVPGSPYVGATVDSLRTGTEYDVHTVTADASGVLTLTAVDAPIGSYVSSWQLTPVPEPGALWLAAAGLAVLGALKHKGSCKT